MSVTSKQGGSTGRRNSRESCSQDDGVSAVEFSLISLVLFFSVFALVDLSRYFYARSIAQNALAYAIKRAESEFNTVVEFDQLNQNSPEYVKYNAARSAILGEAEGMLAEARKAVRFFESRDIDDMADGMFLREVRPISYLLPGKASAVIDPTIPHAQAEIVQNQNICWKRAGRPIDQGGVEYYPADSHSCSAGIFRTTESYKSLTKIYPIEMVSMAKFSGILARNIPMTVRVAGFLPEHTDGPITSSDTPTPTPTTTFVSTPPPTITATPVASETPTQIGTPTQTGTPATTPTLPMVSTPTPFVVNTPTATATYTVVSTPTNTATSTSTPLPTFTSTPVWTPTHAATPTPQVVCPDANVALKKMDGYTEKHDGVKFVFNSSKLIYDETRKMWYDNHGGSTWTCQKNSHFKPLADGNYNLVYNFDWRRSNAKRNDLQGRLNFAVQWIDILGERFKHFCYVCGLMRFNDGCFPPGVTVTLGDGKTTKKVEDVAAGDMLWNPYRKKAFRVGAVSEGAEKNPLVHIRAGTLILRASGEHPVLTGNGVKQAKQVKVGDTVQDANLKVWPVEDVRFEPAPAGLAVINFILERDGQGHEGVLLADGIAVGDLITQKKIATPK